MKTDLTFLKNYVNIQSLQDAIENGNGTKLKNSNEHTSIPIAISSEIAAFQKRSGDLQLLQRVLAIDWDGRKASKYVLGETCHAIQKIAQNWKITAITNNSSDDDYSLINHLSKKTVLELAVKNKLLKMPFTFNTIGIVISTILMGILGFVLLRAVYNITFILLSALAVPVIVGSIVYHIRKNLFFRKFNVNHIKALLSQNRGTPEYNLMVAEFAHRLSQEMPLAVIVEDFNELDDFSVDAMKYIMVEEKVSSIGAIFWVLFYNSQQDKTLAGILKHPSLTIKHYSVVSSIEMPKGA